MEHAHKPVLSPAVYINELHLQKKTVRESSNSLFIPLFSSLVSLLLMRITLSKSQHLIQKRDLHAVPQNLRFIFRFCMCSKSPFRHYSKKNFPKTYFYHIFSIMDFLHSFLQPPSLSVLLCLRGIQFHQNHEFPLFQEHPQSYL